MCAAFSILGEEGALCVISQGEGHVNYLLSDLSVISN